MDGDRYHPTARTEDLIIREMAGELLVYDTRTDRATALNHIAARVWRACDGESDVQMIASQASTAGEAMPVEAVWKALDLLEKANLLARPLVIPLTVLAGESRRSFMRKTGITALVAVPVVAGITAPSPAEAATLRSNGSPCTIDSQCASRFCNLFQGTCGPFV